MLSVKQGINDCLFFFLFFFLSLLNLWYGLPDYYAIVYHVFVRSSYIKNKRNFKNMPVKWNKLGWSYTWKWAKQMLVFFQFLKCFFFNWLYQCSLKSKKSDQIDFTFF